MKQAGNFVKADNKSVNKKIQLFTAIGSFLVSISIMPTLSYDAVTIPKIMILYGLGFGLLGLLLKQNPKDSY
jgi:hypothetical protein